MAKGKHALSGLRVLDFTDGIIYHEEAVDRLPEEKKRLGIK